MPVYRRTPAEDALIQRMRAAPAYTVLRPADAPKAQAVPDDCWFLSAVDGKSGAYHDRVMAEAKRLGIDVAYAGGLALEPERDDELGCFDSDDEAVLYALHDGFSLVKLPDWPGAPYFRWHVIRPWPTGTRFPEPAQNPEKHGIASGRTFKLGGVPYRLPPAISVQWAPANQAWLVLWNAQVLRIISDRDELRDYLRSLGAQALNPPTAKERLLAW